MYEIFEALDRLEIDDLVRLQNSKVMYCPIEIVNFKDLLKSYFSYDVYHFQNGDTNFYNPERVLKLKLLENIYLNCFEITKEEYNILTIITKTEEEKPFLNTQSSQLEDSSYDALTPAEDFSNDELTPVEDFSYDALTPVEDFSNDELKSAFFLNCPPTSNEPESSSRIDLKRKTSTLESSENKKFKFNMLGLCKDLLNPEKKTQQQTTILDSTHDTISLPNRNENILELFNSRQEPAQLNCPSEQKPPIHNDSGPKKQKLLSHESLKNFLNEKRTPAEQLALLTGKRSDLVNQIPKPTQTHHLPPSSSTSGNKTKQPHFFSKTVKDILLNSYKTEQRPIETQFPDEFSKKVLESIRKDGKKF